MKTTQLGNILGMVGVVYGIYNGINKNQNFTTASIYTIIFGIGGVLIGNTISKMND